MYIEIYTSMCVYNYIYIYTYRCTICIMCMICIICIYAYTILYNLVRMTTRHSADVRDGCGQSLEVFEFSSGQFLRIPIRTISNRGSQIPEPLVMFTSTHPSKVQISLGLGPFFQIELLKTDRRLASQHFKVRASQRCGFGLS